jgi:hypothetical protein
MAMNIDDVYVPIRAQRLDDVVGIADPSDVRRSRQLSPTSGLAALGPTEQVRIGIL